MKAFAGNAGQKAELMASLAEPSNAEEIVLLRCVPEAPEQLAAFSAAFGLHPSLVILIKAIGPMAGEESFAVTVVEALPPGLDTEALVRRWILWAWSEAPARLRDRVLDADLRTKAEGVADLHRRALAGEVVSRQQWRQARAALFGAPGTDVVQAAAMEAIAAASWDLQTTPGAVLDLITGWRAMVLAEVDISLQWTADKEAALAARSKEASAAAQAAVKASGEVPMLESASVRVKKDPHEFVAWISKDPEGIAWSDKFMEHMDKARAEYTRAHPSDLDNRAHAQGEASDNIYRCARDGLLRQIHALAAEP